VRRYLFEEKESFHPTRQDVVVNKQRVSTSFNEGDHRNGGVDYKIVRVENTNSSSKSRLLHSSFYLYKLNQRHHL
jgi:hypothetical protein